MEIIINDRVDLVDELFLYRGHTRTQWYMYYIVIKAVRIIVRSDQSFFLDLLRI